MKLDRVVALEAIYNAENGTTFMNGIQALVRLPSCSAVLIIIAASQPLV